MRLTELKSRCQQGHVPSDGSKGEPTAFSLPAFRGHLHSLACRPILHLQSSGRTSSNLADFALSLPLSFIFKDPYDDSGPIQIV